MICQLATQTVEDLVNIVHTNHDRAGIHQKLGPVLACSSGSGEVGERSISTRIPLPHPKVRLNQNEQKMAPKRHAASNPGGAIAAAAATTTATASSSSSLPSSKVTQRSTHSSPGLTPNSPPQAIIQHIWQRYLAQTPQRTLLLDAFMAFLVLVGGIQFVYCVLAGNYVCRSPYVLTSKPPPSLSCLDFHLLIIDCWVSLLMRS